MKKLAVIDLKDIPKNFTGIAEYPNGDRECYKEGKLHREDGPAVEYSNGEKEWWIDGARITGTINVTGKIFLGKEKGRYNLEWLCFLSETGIEEFPVLPGFEQTLVQYFSIEEYVSHHKRIKNENE